MPNANTFTFGVPGLPSAGLGNVTGTAALFQGGKSPSSSAAGNLTLTLPQSGILANRRLRFTVAGRVTPGTSSTFTCIMLSGSTVGSGTMMTSGAMSAGTANYNFFMIGEAYWDSTANILQGSFWGSTYANATTAIIDVTAFSTALSSNPTTGTGQAFTVSGLFGSSNASNNAFIDVFECEVI